MLTKTITLFVALLIAAVLGASLAAREEEDIAPEVRKVVLEVEQWPVWQHAELTSALRRSFDKRMFTPEREWAAKYSDLAGDSGVDRILHRGRYAKETWVRGGGAYFSFTSKSHDYDKGPDIELQNGVLSSGFYGGNMGHVVELTTSDLRTVRPESVPEWMRESAAKLFEERRRDARAKARAGAVYAVRAVREEEADTLAVIQVLSIDEDGATFAWRVLERYPVWSRR